MKKLSHMLPLFLLCGLLLFASGCGRNKNNDNGSTNNTVPQQTEDSKVTDRMENDTVTDQSNPITENRDPVSDNDPDHLNNSVTSGVSDNAANDTGTIINDAENADGTILDDAGNGVNDMIDGAENVVEDVTNGVGNAVDDMTDGTDSTTTKTGSATARH